MIKDIFVPLLGQPGDDAALDSAIALAQINGARVFVQATAVAPMPFFSEVGFAANEVNTLAYEQARAQAELIARSARRRLTDAAVEFDVRIVDTSAMGRAKALADDARYCDLSIVGGSATGTTDPIAAAAFQSLLIQSGRPVIVVPPARPLQPNPRRVVVAWQPSREAVRALHDALPLMEGGETVDVLVVGGNDAEGREAFAGGERIAEKLSRLGLPARAVSQPADGRSEGDSLLDYSEENDADLLVMGGYGHSRLHHLILGGTTRTVLDGLSMPVFFEH